MRSVSILLAGATLVASCSVAEPTEHLRLDASVEPAVVAVGTPVTIRVRLSNAPVSGARTAVVSGSSTCTFRYEIRTPSGAVVAPTSGGACTSDLRNWRIEPGQHVEQTLTWHGTVAPGSTERVPPGSYVVVGVLTSNEIRMESAGTPIQLLP